MIREIGRLITPLALLLAAAPVLGSGDERAAYIRSHYAKCEYRIPMRDGVHLFTAVYTPTDRSQTYPFLMIRTPYSVGPYGADSYAARLGPTQAFEG